MANSSINLIDLDFNSLKSSLKSYLSSQTKFQDYNFDGSNMSVLLDILAYNSYLNTFYLNMVASEMFLDTAQLRDSIISHAKELNYVPRSFRSAQANVNIAITTPTTATSIVIPAKTGFTSRVGSNTFNFVTNEAIAITLATTNTVSNTNTFYANNTILYEGSYITGSFVINSAIEKQRFILNNPTIDTTSIEVTVSENSGANVYVYTQAYSLFGLVSDTNAFFVQPAENEQYEIVFGDNISGRSPRNGAIVDVSYRICNGELPNGADTFVNNSAIDGHSNVSIVINSEAVSGSVSESNNSIKFNAPRSFQTQERAVTESDYEILLTREFPEIQAIAVYGGEKEDPPQYGKVFISVDITNSDGIPDVKKTLYNSYLKDKVPLGITTEIVNPQFIYLRVDTIVNYNYNITTLSENQLITKVQTAIANFNTAFLNGFNANFRYSNFVTAVDNVDPSILNNDTTITPYYLLTLQTGIETDFKFSFNTEVLVTSPTEAVHSISTDKGVFSSTFIVNGLTSQIEDDGLGNLRVVSISAEFHSEKFKIGTVDYATGAIAINNLNVESFTGSGIKLYIKPTSKDYSTTLKNILKIDSSDVTVTMVPKKS
jgi:hypothetical protein